MRVLWFAAALLSAIVTASTAGLACSSVEHVSASKGEYNLTPGSPDDCIRSSDGRYELHMQKEGSLALYDNRHPGHVLIWQAKLAGAPQQGSKAVLRNDGSLVVLDPSGKEAWRSAAAGGMGDYFIMISEKGRLEVYKGSTLSDPAKSVVWASSPGDMPDADGVCQCHITNTDGSPGKSSGDAFDTCGLTSCRSFCASKKDYFGDALIGTYNKGTGKCKAF
jgi:hypothetical protein